VPVEISTVAGAAGGTTWLMKAIAAEREDHLRGDERCWSSPFKAPG